MCPFFFKQVFTFAKSVLLQVSEMVERKCLKGFQYSVSKHDMDWKGSKNSCDPWKKEKVKKSLIEREGEERKKLPAS